jgi:hypothetical protein
MQLAQPMQDHTTRLQSLNYGSFYFLLAGRVRAFVQLQFMFQEPKERTCHFTRFPGFLVYAFHWPVNEMPSLSGITVCEKPVFFTDPVSQKIFYFPEPFIHVAAH